MIYLYKNQVNEVCLSLGVDALSFDFKFINILSLEEVEITLNDISDFKDRYNLFLLTDGVDYDFRSGQWKYEVRNNGELVDSGRMVVENGNTNSIYD